jgi:hypothetical protein
MPRHNPKPAAARSFDPISGEIEPCSDRRLPELMLRLVKEDALYHKFAADRRAVVAESGIDPDLIDLEMFAGLAAVLRDRVLRGDKGFKAEEETIKSKASSEGTYKNFDNSESRFKNYDSNYGIWRTKGVQASKTKSEDSYTNKDFAGVSTGAAVEHLLKSELCMFFFPSQPLVSPELVAAIKSTLKKPA